MAGAFSYTAAGEVNATRRWDKSQYDLRGLLSQLPLTLRAGKLSASGGLFIWALGCPCDSQLASLQSSCQPETASATAFTTYKESKPSEDRQCISTAPTANFLSHVDIQKWHTTHNLAA